VTPVRTHIEVGGRELTVSNLDKVLWPKTGFTKGDLIDYYRTVAAVMVPHLAGRPITLRRWPDGVDAQHFFQKHAPKHRPDWVPVVELGGVQYLRIEEPAALVWAANLAAIEIHPGLATAADLDRPAFLVLDLDPGPPADVMTCARVALILREYLERLHLRAWPKTSGSKGLQLYVPLGGPGALGATTFEDTRRAALALAQIAEREHPDLIVSAMDPQLRRDKVMIDWSQNAPSRTTVAVYSVRARDFPSVSTPVTWEEVEGAKTPEDLRFDTAAVLARVADLGDLMAPVLQTEQELPALRS
jgi:bifunctional non-homologous end joining protein LigD